MFKDNHFMNMQQRLFTISLQKMFNKNFQNSYPIVI